MLKLELMSFERVHPMIDRNILCLKKAKNCQSMKHVQVRAQLLRKLQLLLQLFNGTFRWIIFTFKVGAVSTAIIQGYFAVIYLHEKAAMFAVINGSVAMATVRLPFRERLLSPKDCYYLRQGA